MSLATVIAATSLLGGLLSACSDSDAAARRLPARKSDGDCPKL